jgi:hypothetical protein
MAWKYAPVEPYFGDGSRPGRGGLFMSASDSMLKMGHGFNGVAASHLPAKGVAATLLTVACVTEPDEGPDLDNDGSAGN